MKGFIDFVRSQGVVGLAVGFILGGSVTKVVTSLVNDIINPILGIVLGSANLSSMSLHIGPAELKYGSFLSAALDFMIVAMVVYYIVKGMGLDKLDKKKDA